MADFGTLPKEIIVEIMYRMAPQSLFMLSMVSKVFVELSNSENLWRSKYLLVLPKTEYALQLAPFPEYWKFNNVESRRFLYLTDLLNQKHEIKLLPEVSLVMEVLACNLHSLSILKAAAYIIRRLCFYPEKCQTHYKAEIEGNRELFGSKGVIKYFLNGMVEFINHTDYLSAALCALGNLAIHQPNSDELVRLGGIKIILNCMKKYVQHFPVIDYGAFVLCNVADYANHKESVRNEEGLRFVLDNIKNETTPKDHLVPFLDLLAVLVQGITDSENGQFTRNDIFTQITHLIKKNNSDSQLLAHCLTVLVVLVEHSDQQFYDEMIPLLFSIISEHESSSPIVLKGTLVLFTYFWNNNTNPDIKENKKKLIDVIIKALINHPTALLLQRTGAAMLADFATEDVELKNYIKTHGGEPLFARAVSLGSDDIDFDQSWELVAGLISI